MSKYFANELTAEEKKRLLYEVSKEENLREEFLDNQNMVTLVDWIFPRNEEELAQKSLLEFMRRLEKRRNT